VRGRGPPNGIKEQFFVGGLSDRFVIKDGKEEHILTFDAGGGPETLFRYE